MNRSCKASPGYQNSTLGGKREETPREECIEGVRGRGQDKPKKLGEKKIERKTQGQKKNDLIGFLEEGLKKKI